MTIIVPCVLASRVHNLGALVVVVIPCQGQVSYIIQCGANLVFRYETVFDLCSTVLGASTRRSPASCLRTHGARGRLFAVGSTCCLSARPAAPLSCWPFEDRVRAPDLLESAAKVGATSLVECWKPLYLWLSSLAPNFLWRRKEVTDLERGRGHPGTSLEEL